MLDGPHHVRRQSSYHDQLLVWELLEGPTHDLDVLVAARPPDDEEEARFEAVRGCLLASGLDRHGWRQDVGPDVVGVLHPLLDDAGVHQVARGLRGRSLVPAVQTWPEPAQGRADDLRLGEQVVLRLVDPPRRVVAVDDLRRVGRDPVREAARAADDDVHVLHRHAVERPGQQRKRFAGVLTERRDVLQPAGLDLDVAELGVRPVRVVHRGQEPCLRERPMDGQRDALSPPTLRQVVVHHSHPDVHGREDASLPWEKPRSTEDLAPRMTTAIKHLRSVSAF
jgi:hypothetical protein